MVKRGILETNALYTLRPRLESVDFVDLQPANTAANSRFACCNH